MVQSLIQPSFAAGELAPALAARVDLAKYHVGAKVMRNFFVQTSGGAANRPGTRFVGRARDSSQPVRLISFQFSTQQTYVLEFGHQYMRVIMDGGHVLEPSFAVTGTTATNPVMVAAAGHDFANGDEVFLAGTGIVRLDGNRFLVAAAAAGTFQLATLDGTAVDATTWGAYGGTGATVARVYTLATPYAGADLALLKHTQSADVMTLTHTGYAPMDLSRTQHWAWALTPITFQPKVAAPVGISAIPKGSGSQYYSYLVTAVTASPNEESLPSAPAGCRNAALNQDTGVINTISWTPVAGAATYQIYKAPVGTTGPIPAGSIYGYIGSTAGTTFDDANIAADTSQTPPQGVNPFVSNAIASVTVTHGGTGYTSAPLLTVSDPTGSGAVLTATVASGAITGVTVVDGGSGYSDSPTIEINSGSGGGGAIQLEFGYDGSTGTLCLTGAYVLSAGSGYVHPVATISGIGHGSDSPMATLSLAVTNGNISGVTVTAAGTGYIPGTGPGVAIITDTGAGAGSGAVLTPVLRNTPNNPGCVTYFQQRKVFAGSSSQPETLWMTQTGNFANMDTSSPSRADDAITATIATSQVNAIKHLVSVNALLALSASGAFQISGGGTTAALTPSNTVVTSQAYSGCNDVPPLVINYDILYIQSKGSTVRDLSYNFYVDIYTGSDMTVLSGHLFFGYQITSWCWAEEPFKLVWAVRNDGVLLCLTYLKEQDVYAWSHHDTAGRFTAVTSVPEGAEDAVYAVVTRTIPGQGGGQPLQYIERLASRNFLTGGLPDVTQGWFVDCGLKYQGTPTATVNGLGHLDGAEVTILADGNVQPAQVVSGGSITLPHPASTIIVGLPYTADLVTLDVDAGEPTVQGKRKKISAVTLRLENSRGLKVGPGAPGAPNDAEGGNAADGTTLVEIKERGGQAYGQAIPLTTGDERILLSPSWNTQGSVWIRQDNPLPATILGVIPEVRGGDAAG